MKPKPAALCGLITMLMALATLATPVHAQTGSITGMIIGGLPSESDTIVGATVRAQLIGTGFAAETVSDYDGFQLLELPVGLYDVLALYPGAGFATDIAEVSELATTVIELNLIAGEGIGDEQPLVTLSGNIDPAALSDSGDGDYLIQSTLDSVADFRLILGPPGYQPIDSLLALPLPGSAVTVEGRLFGYSRPIPVVVQSINGRVWRDARSDSHGGTGGIWYDFLVCDSALVRCEFSGWVENTSMLDSTRYILHTEEDSLSLFLDFGTESYNPEDGVVRPEHNEYVHIVGGYVAWCLLSSLPRVIVYELNGHHWRTPGDTAGLDVTMPVDPPQPALPVSELLAENYPNPFNPTTTITFALPVAGWTSVSVHDLLGREVVLLASSHLTAGRYSVTWDAAAFATGLYFYRIQCGDLRVTKRMLLLK